MATSPFFSGRIPKELNEKIIEHCQTTGETKTQVLTKALSSYINFPITEPIQTSNNPTQITVEMFESLSQEITNIKANLKELEEKYNNVISSDNIVIQPRKYQGNIEEKQSDNNNKDTVISNDNSETSNAISADNKEVNYVIIADNNNKNTDLELQKLPQNYENIVTAEVEKISNLTRRKLDTLMSKAIEKAKSLGFTIEEKQLLPEKVQVNHKEGITVNDIPYKLFYLGLNTKDRAIWDLIPDDNIADNYDNTNYHFDIPESSYDKVKQNKNDNYSNSLHIEQENIESSHHLISHNSPAQESVEKSVDEQI